MQLHEAKEVFDTSPSDEACAAYLRAASAAWLGNHIKAEAFLIVVERVAEWLADE